MVDESGCYTAQAGESLQHKFVLDDGNKAILEIVANDVLHKEIFVHSYPYDWRTKQPVILRASRQWFVNTDAIKTRAIVIINIIMLHLDYYYFFFQESISNIQILPKINAESHTNNLISQLQKRPYWCISRQRKWGVPIPVFYKNNNEDAIIDKETITHLIGLLDKYGADFWWSLPLKELIPSSLNLIESDVTKGEVCINI